VSAATLLFEGRFAKVISCEYRYISVQNKNTLFFHAHLL
jgi:hypothetical protein